MCALAVLLALLAACSREAELADTAKPAPPVSGEAVAAVGEPTVNQPAVAVLQVIAQPVALHGSYLGYAAPNKRVSLRAETEGLVELVNFSEGAYVGEGQVLVHISTRQLTVERDRARANLQLAESDLRRDRQAMAKNLIPQSQLDVSEAAEREAFFNLQLTELNLVKSVIRSPLSGQVKIKAVETGEFVRKAQQLAEIIELHPILVDIYVPEQEIRFLEESHPATAVIESLPEGTFAGRVRTIGLEADQRQGSFRVQIEIPNRDRRIRPGMLARVELVLRSLADQVIVPSALIQDREDGHILYVLDGGRAVERRISLGFRIGDQTQIANGLRPGEELVVSNIHRLSEGVPVRVMERTLQTPR
ncbi:MAG: efflux RND transporter periplasmic adaptor subunit [Candidatus Lambdaproteobacteria bacterium]|nr:efflux RND transporter periplasmic adaptor subunit [Candidatus Lambdaproteobacteria bacterium]